MKPSQLRALISVISIFMSIAYAESFPSNHQKREEAREAYEKSEYKESISIWKGLMHEGISDPDIYYNIGNANAMLGNVPEAILAFEKALRFSPGDKRIRNAISGQRSKIENSTVPVPPFFLAKWFDVFRSVLRPGAWAYLGLLCMLIALVLWFKRIGIIKLNIPAAIRSIRILLFAGLVMMVLAIFSYRAIYRKDEAILFINCNLHQGPSAQSPNIRSLSAGEKVKISDSISGWHHVVLLNLDEGWLKEECLRIIDLQNNL